MGKGKSFAPQPIPHMEEQSIIQEPVSQSGTYLDPRLGLLYPAARQGGLGSLQEESECVRLWHVPPLRHRGSGAQESQVRSLLAELCWTSLWPLPGSCVLPGRESTKLVLPTSQSGWDGNMMSTQPV